MSSGKRNKTIKAYYVHYYNHREDPNIPFPNIVYPNPPPPPLINKYCDCKIMSIRKQVKSGKNMGRLFYSCSKFGTSMHNERCNFFCWEEPRIIKTPLKYTRRKKSLNDFFSKISKENKLPTTPINPLPRQTITQLYNSNKSTRSNKSLPSIKKIDQVQQNDDNHIWEYIKTLEKRLEKTKGELDKTRLEYNDLEILNKNLKRKLQDEEERNDSLIKSNKRLRKDLDDKNKRISRLMENDTLLY